MFNKKISKIKELVQANRLEQSLSQTNDLLLHTKYIDDVDLSLINEYENQIILFANRLKRIKSEIISNTKPNEQLTIEQNNIVSSYLLFLSDIEKLTLKIEESDNNKELEFSNKISDLEFLVYLSDSKLDMLSSQIPLNGLGKTNQTKLLKSIIEKLERNNLIGNLNEDKPYIFGEIDMLWGSILRRSAIFLSNESALKILLFGSSFHILGEENDKRLITEGNSSLMHMMRRTLSEFEYIKLPEIDESRESPNRLHRNFQRLIYFIEREQQYKGEFPKERLKFIARKYKTFDYETGEKLIVGSPIFVSLSNE